jgi:glycosyltransferase involved in cell wall biosynthesis
METFYMRRTDRKGLRAPARVLDLELAPAGQPDDDVLPVEQYSTVWCLSRVGGLPREISFWDVADDAGVRVQDLRDQLRPEGNAGQVSADLPAAGAANLAVTVVICTRDRAAGLRTALASLERQTDPDFRVLVVDNGSSSPEPEAVVSESGLPRCEYVTEPRPGLSRARNRALEEVHTELVAWLDDDEIADPTWVLRLKEGFAHPAKPAAVCGVMLPAELESEAQVRFEQYGGFNKGRGMAPEVLRAGTSTVISPLYPLPSFGAGGNMAFRTQDLKAVGRFDPYLGAGTRTHGGEETRALSLLLSSGHAMLHWPAAITWHTHRREMAALRKQFYGYSAGLSAFYASMLRSRPAVAFDLVQLAPLVLRDFRHGSGNQRSGDLPDDFPPQLRKAARRGLLEGGFLYAYEAIRERRQPAPVSREGALSDAAHT